MSPSISWAARGCMREESWPMGTGEATVFCCVPSCTAARALCSQTSGALLAAAARCAAVLRAASSPYIAVSVRIGCASGMKTIFPVADSMLMGSCRSFPASGDMSTSLPAPPFLAPNAPGAATAKSWFCGRAWPGGGAWRGTAGGVP
jgi:hypothetical protein